MCNVRFIYLNKRAHGEEWNDINEASKIGWCYGRFKVEEGNGVGGGAKAK